MIWAWENLTTYAIKIGAANFKNEVIRLIYTYIYNSTIQKISKCNISKYDCHISPFFLLFPFLCPEGNAGKE